MPDHPVIEAANAFRAQLLRQERAAAVRMVREYGRIYAGLQPQIDALILEIGAMPDPSPAKVARLTRFKALQSQIESEMSRFGAWADTEIMASARVAASDGERHSKELALLTLPAALRSFDLWRNVSAQAIEQLLPFMAINSPIHAALIDELGPSVNEVIAKNVAKDIGNGLSNVSSAIRAALGTALSWILRTARTVALWAYRETMRANYVANSDIVTGWIWHSELGPRTCMACIAQHGTLHPNSEVLSDHHNGRCIAIPITKTIPGIPDTNPQVQSGREWFASLSPAQQASYMPSQAMFNAWQQGAVKWDDLVGSHDDAVYGSMLQLPSLKAILGEDAVKYYVR